MYYATTEGQIFSLYGIKHKKMSISVNTKGYGAVGLIYNGVASKREVHRLVYEAFRGPIPKGYVIDHIDNNPLNNKISNLRIVTQKENVRKARDLGRTKNNIEAARLNGRARAKGFVPQSGIPFVYWNKVAKAWFGAKYIDGVRYYTPPKYKDPGLALEELTKRLP